MVTSGSRDGDLGLAGHMARRHRAQQRLLLQVEADEILHVTVDELVVGQPVAEGVDEAEVPRQPRRQQNGGHVGQLPALVVGAILIGAAVYDPHRLHAPVR